MLYESFRRALAIVEQCFEDICLIDQDILGTDERVANFLKIFPEVEDRESFKKKMMTQTTSKNRWDAFVAHWNSLKSSVSLDALLKKSLSSLLLCSDRVL